MVDSTLNINIKSDKANRDIDKIDRNLNQLDKTGKKVSKTILRLGPLLAGIVTIETLRRAAKLADSYRNIQNRLRLATSTTGELLDVQERLLQISNQTFSSFESNANTFQRFEVTTRSLGLASKELLDLQEGLALSFRIAGTDAVGTAAAMTQLSQGLGAGALRGDEFRSVAEQNVILLEALAKELGVGVGQLKAYAAEGKITADVVNKAVQNNLKAWRELNETIEVSVSGSFVVLGNNLIQAIGVLDQATGASEAFSNAILGISAAIKEMADGPSLAEREVEALKELEKRQKIVDKLAANARGQTAEGSRRRLKQAKEELAVVQELLVKRAKEIATEKEANDLKTESAEIDKLRLKTMSALQKAILDLGDQGLNQFQLAFKELEKLNTIEKAIAEGFKGSAEERLALMQQIKMARGEVIIGLTLEKKKVKEVEVALTDMEKVGVAAATTLADGFAEFALNSEASFEDFAASFLKMIAKMIIQQQVLNALQAVGQGGGFFGKLFSGLTPSADGNAFSGGNVIPFANGGVVNKPTLFPMANGAGLMGEAGPEAILPLSRGSDGKLGVKSTGGGVVVNVINNSTGTQIEQQTSSDGARIDVIISDIVKQGFADGSFDATLRQSFNVRRAGR